MGKGVGSRYLPPLLVLQTLFGQAAAASYADTYENYLAPAQKLGVGLFFAQVYLPTLVVVVGSQNYIWSSIEHLCMLTRRDLPLKTKVG